MADGLRHAAACGVFTAQGLSSWLLHWQMDSLPLSRQEAQFFENPPYCFHIDYQFTFPPTAHQGSLFSTPSPAFVICVIFYNGLFCLIYVLIDLSPWFPPPPRGESKSKHITSSENVDRLKKIKIHLFLRCNLHILFAIGWFKEVLTVTAFWVGGSRLSLFFQREFLVN